jgi:hypothetical protein
LLPVHNIPGFLYLVNAGFAAAPVFKDAVSGVE